MELIASVSEAQLGLLSDVSKGVDARTVLEC